MPRKQERKRNPVKNYIELFFFESANQEEQKRTFFG